MTDETNMTELLEKISIQQTEIDNKETLIKEHETKISELETTILDRDNQIIKLQKLLADNLIATKIKPEDDITIKPFKEGYKDMINRM